jgi:hypothetical protein
VKPYVIRAHAEDDGFTAMLPFFKHDSVQMWLWMLQQARPTPHQTREVLPGLLDIISNPSAIMELSELTETCNRGFHVCFWHTRFQIPETLLPVKRVPGILTSETLSGACFWYDFAPGTRLRNQKPETKK